MANQPISPQAQMTADANGMASAEFEAVPNMLTWTAILHVDKAPTTAQFCAENGPTALGCFWGSTPYGPIQLDQGEKLTVEGRGLVPGRVYNVFLIGQSTDADVPFVWPSPAAVPLTTSAQFIANDSATAVGNKLLIASPGSDNSLIVYTAQIAAAAALIPSGSLDASVLADTVGAFHSLMGIWTSPAFGNFGGLILPAGARVFGGITSNPDAVLVRWRVTYSILPTS